MIDTILVPLDGSELAARAIPSAAMLARSTAARIVLMHALTHQAPGSALDERAPTVSDLNLDAEALRADGVSVDTVVRPVRPVQATDVARAITVAADEQRAGLIVMSTHGRSGFGRWLYGSVTDSVLHQSPIPVLLIPEHAGQPLPTDRSLRILVPLDGSQFAEEAIGAAELLAGTTDAELLLLRVVEVPSYPLYGEGYAYIPYDPASELAEARRYLQGVIDRLQADGKRVTARAVIGQPSSMVAHIAQDEEVDIVTMATHGRGGLARLVLGSVATATVQRADVPVLLARPAAMRHVDEASHVALGVGGGARMASASTAQLATPTGVDGA